MNVITLRDYAKQNNISYEAVRKQVVRYAKELGDHIIKDGRQQFLDEEAVEFLDAKRQKNPVAIIQMDKDDKIRELEETNKNLLIKVAQQAEELREADKALAKVDQLLLSAKEDKERAEALEAQNADLSAEKEKAEQKEAEALKEAEKANLELSEALEKIERMKHATFWQRLRGFKE